MKARGVPALRALITGANGFLGRHVVAEFLRRGPRSGPWSGPPRTSDAWVARRGQVCAARRSWSNVDPAGHPGVRRPRRAGPGPGPWPRRRNSATTCRPRKPLAPVIRAFKTGTPPR